MPGLLDLAKQTETVSIRGVSVEIRGLSLEIIARLMGRFPELLEAMDTRSLAPLSKVSGGCIGAIIAAGCGMIGDEAAEDLAANLPMEEQLDLLAPILRFTMPGGVGPFGAKAVAAIKILNPQVLGQDGKAPVMTSPPPPNP